MLRLKLSPNRSITYNDSVIKKTWKHFSRGYVIFLLILDILGHYAIK